jgi:predicted nucleic acid-binding protein
LGQLTETLYRPNASCALEAAPDRVSGGVRTMSDALTLPLDQRAADEAAEIRRTLDLAGASIGMGDSLIAGVVRFHDAELVTRNRRHFDRVRGLKLSLVAPAP